MLTLSSNYKCDIYTSTLREINYVLFEPYFSSFALQLAWTP